MNVIKPEDVPKSLVYDMYAQMKRCLDLEELGMPVSTEQQIADLLNMCIEAGLVSPPCHVLRYDDGSLMTDDDGAIWIGAGKPKSPIFEHWDGRTE